MSIRRRDQRLYRALVALLSTDVSAETLRAFGTIVAYVARQAERRGEERRRERSGGAR